MSAKRLRIVFAGGGTGGHLFPGLAIADEIRSRYPEAMITFIGTKAKIEARVVPQRGYDFVPIWISGFRRSLSVGNLLFPVKLAVALMQSYLIMKRLKPDVVVGTGGYVCGPPLYVASRLRIPTLIQEQNSYPGATTRALAGKVDEVHISFEASRKWLTGDNVKLSGNPTGRRLGTIGKSTGISFFSLDGKRPVLFVFGGSLGAASINAAMEKALPELVGSGIQVIWQTGTTDYERLAQAVSGSSEIDKSVRMMKFIDTMEHAYAAADLAVCRAGASTLAELTVCGVPAVLVPYPHAAADHQTINARTLVEQGAAVMIADHELHDRLLPVVTRFVMNPEELESMRSISRSLAKPEATAALADAVVRIAGASR